MLFCRGRGIEDFSNGRILVLADHSTLINHSLFCFLGPLFAPIHPKPRTTHSLAMPSIGSKKERNGKRNSLPVH